MTQLRNHVTSKNKKIVNVLVKTKTMRVSMSLDLQKGLIHAIINI